LDFRHLVRNGGADLFPLWQASSSDGGRETSGAPFRARWAVIGGALGRLRAASALDKGSGSPLVSYPPGCVRGSVSGRSRVLGLLQRPFGTLDLLVYLQKEGIRSISAIIRDVRFSPPSAYAAIHRLLELGFIFERTQRGVENRVVFGVTAKGEKVARALGPIQTEVEETLAGYLGRVDDSETRDISETPEAIQLRLSLADVAFLRGDWKTALTTAKQAARLAKAAREQRLLGRSYLAMGKVLQKRDELEAPKVLESAFHTAMQAGDPATAAEAQYLRGCLRERHGEYETSQGLYQEASDLARKGQDQILLGKAQLGFSRILWRAGEDRKAIRICEDAARIFESAGEEGMSELPGAYVAMGAFWFKRDQHQALRWHEMAIKLAERLADVRTHGYALANAAAIYINEDQDLKAEGALNRAVEIFERLEEPRMLADAHLHLGNLEVERKHWTKSDAHFRKAATGFQRLDHPYGLAETWLHHGKSKATQGRTGAARTLIQRAGETFGKIGCEEKVEEARRVLAGLN